MGYNITVLPLKLPLSDFLREFLKGIQILFLKLKIAKNLFWSLQYVFQWVKLDRLLLLLLWLCIYAKSQHQIDNNYNGSQIAGTEMGGKEQKPHLAGRVSMYNYLPTFRMSCQTDCRRCQQHHISIAPPHHRTTENSTPPSSSFWHLGVCAHKSLAFLHLPC